jgi:endonuclease/exonuclease/phosphatase family metal-dependent hydrolase
VNAFVDASGMPPAVAADVQGISAAARAAIPARTDANHLVATWNLRAFAGLTAKWEAGPGESPQRDWHAVACIAAVLSCFDVVAVQEVRRDVSALRFLMDRLGPDWRFLTTDVTEGSSGNGERLTFLHRTDRVQPSGLVGEIVLPDGGTSGGPATQFARTPYAASFVRDTVEFILTTAHIIWGADPAGRLEEITQIAQWMRAWADRPGDWNDNLLVLGDFNLDRLDDPLYQAFASTGLFPPAELNHVPRTIFDNDRTRHFYDQIAWFSQPDGTSLLRSLTHTDHGGSFDFVPHAFTGLSRTQLSWRISDHFPLWVEFTI